MVRPEGVEPPTYWFVASCSIQLSYGRTLRGMQPSKNTGILTLEQTDTEMGWQAQTDNMQPWLYSRSLPLILVNGAPGEIRTPDRLVRSQMLYPAELRARKAG
jgi:hypothetical protein